MYHSLINFQPYSLENYRIETLEITSSFLKGNSLGDPYVRYNSVLVPLKEDKDIPVILVLAGFTGNGPNYFNIKPFAKNMIQTIDSCTGKGRAPEALYVFVDAMTFWGGSQFLNSSHTGYYEDYVVQEIVPAVKENYATHKNFWAICGGSSGGYGALHLGSSYPDLFPYIGALAPDSAFEVTLLPDIYKSIEPIKRVGGIKGVHRELKSGRLLKSKHWHDTLNAVGMASCYSPESDGPFDFELPVDSQGRIKDRVWDCWKKKDPVFFLSERRDKIKRLKNIYLSVGIHDQFQLYFGARQIRDILHDQKVSLDYSEFEGSHFDLGQRRPHMWEWFCNQWNL